MRHFQGRYHCVHNIFHISFAVVLQEEEKKGQPNYEHLEEDLHVLISVDDTEDRAKLRLSKAVEKVKDLLQPVVRW